MRGNNLIYLSPLKGKAINWTPDLKANLDLWYDADSNTQSSGLVTGALDLGPNAINLTFGSGVQPTFSANVLNGKPSWSFAGSGADVGTVTTSHSSFATGTEFSLVLVIDQTALTTNSAAFTFLRAGSSTNFSGYFINGFAGYGDLTFGYSDGATGSIAVSSFNYSTPCYVIISYNGGSAGSTSSWGVWRNGVSQTLTTAPSLGGVTGITSIGNASGTNSIIGDWFEQFSYFGSGAAIGGTDLSNIASYMSKKYGL